MTYKVLKSLVYGGIAYAEGQEINIIEKSVAENCLERELIAEITDAEVDRTEVNGETGETGKTDSTEITENNENSEDATEEVVSSETSEETTENVEETTKTNKRNRK
jgi:GTP-binding protein lepA|nr:MAG TPA: hypothetical protein [Caudoviricetes sp.]